MHNRVSSAPTFSNAVPGSHDAAALLESRPDSLPMMADRGGHAQRTRMRGSRALR